MKIVGRTFAQVQPLESPSFDGLALENCRFEGCDYFFWAEEWADKVEARPRVRNCSLMRCFARGSAIGPVIVDDCVVEDFDVRDCRAYATAFRHVTLRGKIGPLTISDDAAPTVEAYNLGWRRVNAAFYQSVDWALDISEAEFTSEPDIRGLPKRLLRRDPTTQIIVRRENAVDRRFRRLDLHGTPWATAIDYMFGGIYEHWPSVLLVAPKRSKKLPDYMRAIQILRGEGIADPD